MPQVTTPLVTTPVAQAWMADKLDMPSFDIDVFEAAINDASQAVLDYMDWDPTPQTATELYDGLGGCVLIVNRQPITAVLSVSIALGYAYLDLAPPNPLVVDVTTLVVDGRQIIWPCGCFPPGIKNVTVSYAAGYATIPGSIQRATLYTLAAMWAASDVDHNASGESYNGVLSQNFWPSGPGAVPPQAIRLLNAYTKKLHAT